MTILIVNFKDSINRWFPSNYLTPKNEGTKHLQRVGFKGKQETIAEERKGRKRRIMEYS